ncbi:hypothetical protein C8D88_106216 [Lentzea atacamensis]|uniref:DUF2690 domain-containing protein n=1 Tax=Lentzea atacamensis TaxID=531938 RepID=A0A316I041_9PSEU|nr:hypothetical protein [Lentzea atacamensis]PWK85588.1 hypothetical protein C8D88_106216 [Lentzea atacamensis]
MFLIRPKALTAAVVIAASLFLPGVAHATSPSVQMEVCNNQNSGSRSFELTGLNQHGVRVSSPIYSIRWRSCQLFANWWWKTGQSLEVRVRGTSLSQTDYFGIPQGTRDGSYMRWWVN